MEFVSWDDYKPNIWKGIVQPCSKPPTSHNYYINHHFPMVFPWFSHGFPMVFQWFSHGFPMVFSWFSHGFPMFQSPPTRSPVSGPSDITWRRLGHARQQHFLALASISRSSSGDASKMAIQKILDLPLTHGSLVMSPCFTSPNHDRYMVFFMATFLGDVQYSQVMGHLPTPV